MSSTSSQKLPSRRRKVLVWATVGLALAFLIYVAAANWLLRSETGQNWIASLSKRTRFHWQGAWTVVPGVVHLDALTVAGGNRQSWTIEAEDVDATVSLFSLISRQFATRRVSVGSLFVRVEPADKAETRVSSGSPPATAPTSRGPGRWRIHLRGAEVAHFRGLQLGTTQLTGDGQVKGAFHYRVRGPMQFSDLVLDMPEATLRQGERLIAEIPVLRLQGDLAEFSPRGADLREVLEGLTAQVELEAHTRSLGFLNGYVGKATWLHFEGGTGDLEARLTLDRGTALPGSSLGFDGSELAAQVLDYRIAGTPTLIGQVDDHGVQLEFRFDDYGLRADETESPYLTGETLTLQLTTSDASLTAAPDLDVVLDLEDGYVPDFRAFNGFFGSLEALELVSGSATIDTHLALTTREQATPEESVISIEGEDIELRYGNLDIHTQLLVTSRISAIKPSERSFDIGHVAVVIDDATLYQLNEPVAEDWHGEFFLLDGELALTRPLHADASLELAMTDARPILAFFSEKRPRVDLIGRVLRLTDVTGSAALAIDDHSIVLDNVAIDAKDLEIEGRICLENKRRRGILHAVVRGIGVAASFEGADRSLALLRSRRWYEERLPGLVCARN